MKGTIKPNHIPVNKYLLKILTLPDITPTKISGLEEELETTDLPDRTRATGGNTKSSEITITIPLHHTVEQAAMEVWFQECQDPVSPTYKKAGTLLMKPISDSGKPVVRTLVGVFVSKRKDPDLEMMNDGEMAVVEWTLSIDQIKPA